MADDSESSSPLGGDGTVDRIWKRSPRAPVAAIFIHAGAGYHSTTNEKVHLDACAEAARVGMKWLKNHATAAEAVEAAIRVLEDKEITNAGFGSNLNMDGVVECDATIVDHLGRSGACGAVPGIKNPISLAKVILDTSNQPLSLRRVPPNILIGNGAKQFAEEHGMPAVRNAVLVSRNAKDRYLKWSDDLGRAEKRRVMAVVSSPPCSELESSQPPTPGDYDKMAAVGGTGYRRDHTNAILTGTWNEGQPDSPNRLSLTPTATPTAEIASPLFVGASPPMTPSVPSRSIPSGAKSPEKSPLSFMTSFQNRTPPVTSKRSKPGRGDEPGLSASPDESEVARHDSPVMTRVATLRGPKRSHRAQASFDSFEERKAKVRQGGDGGDEDKVTDTVGAIAIDNQGNIAAGSSSGGIGMKHSGRIGPAALVGIGTAVIPEDPEDEDLTSVAAVTSGTGEHMATSTASAKCAERLFHCTRRGPGGRNIEEHDERLLLDSFILNDFMGHPGVRDQTSPGAIGVMAVKKCRAGIYFYFAHNTDSFALASLTSTEREPSCVMSRMGPTGNPAQGGRKINTG